MHKGRHSSNSTCSRKSSFLHLFPLMLALPEPSGAQSYLRLGDAVAGPNVAADASDFFVSSQSQTQVGDKACTTLDDNFVAFTHGVSRNAFVNEAAHETKATTDKAIVGGVICSPLLSLAASPVSPASFLSCSPPSASFPCPLQRSWPTSSASPFLRSPVGFESCCWSLSNYVCLGISFVM